MRWLALVIVILILVLGGVYAALPWLLGTVFAAELAALGGLDELRFEMDHPGLDSVTIYSLDASAAGVRVSGQNLRLTYSLDSLTKQRLLTIHAGALAVSLEATAAAEPTSPTADTSTRVPMVADVLPLVPADTVTVEALSVSVPASDFLADGQLLLTNGSLASTLTGRRPAAAANLQIELTADVSGNLHARLSDAHPETPSTLTADAVTRSADLQIQLGADITGYPLELVQQVLGLSPGTGRLRGELNTTLPWPPLDVPDWRTLDGTGRFDLDWSRPASAAYPTAVKADNMNGRIELTQGQVALILSGRLNLSTTDVSLQTILKDSHFDFAADVLRSDAPGARIQFKADDISGEIEPSRLEAELSATPSISLASRLSATRADDKLSGTLIASARLAKPATSGDFSFDGEAASFPLRLTGDYTYAADALQAKLRLKSGAVLDLPLAVTYQIDRNVGLIKVADRLQVGKPLLAATLPGFKEVYDIDQGAIGINGTAGWNADGFTVDLMLEPVLRKAHYDDYLATDLSGQIRFRVEEDRWHFETAEFRVGTLDVGFPLTNLRLTGSGDPDLIRMTSVTAELLGGSAQTTPFDYLPGPGSAVLVATLTNLDLAALLALEGDDITGTGRLDGRVPITVSDNTPSVAGGEIATTGPGTIQLASALASAITQPGLDIALKALENFAYETLAATVNYDADGNMDLGIRLQGRNRSVEAGRPIHYNLNITENIPVLLKSLRLQDSVTKSIEKKVRQ